MDYQPGAAVILKFICCSEGGSLLSVLQLGRSVQSTPSVDLHGLGSMQQIAICVRGGNSINRDDIAGHC